MERQREIIEQWAAQNNHDVIGWAEDLDVSGSVDPFNTPALGPWLSDEKKHDWDIVCSWKLDRISRRAVPMGKLFEWLINNDKVLVCVADSIDLGTPMGRLVAYVIATIAEGELEAIKDRNRSSQKKLRELGRWSGGKPIYGYQSQELADGGGYGLVPDPHAQTVLLGIIDSVLAGESLNSIAAKLNDAGELSPQDYLRARAGKKTIGDHQWMGNNIGRILRSKVLLGYANHNGTTVRDATGAPTQKAEPLVPPELFHQLQATLEGRSVVSGTRTRKVSPLLGVLVCGVCEANMYHRKVTGEKYRYYQCRKGHDINVIKADIAEEQLHHTFLDELGDSQVRERVYIPAENHQIELEEAVRAVEELTSLVGVVASDTVRSRLTEQLRGLDSRIMELEKLPVENARWEYQKTASTYREAWDHADTEGKRQLLLKSGITVAATPFRFDLRIPQDLLERLST